MTARLIVEQAIVNKGLRNDDNLLRREDFPVKYIEIGELEEKKNIVTEREPFEELEQYCNNFPLESMDDTNHSLVPYAVILVKALKAFKDSHQGRRPESREDQETIRALLKSWMRTATEENFVEALKHCHFIKSSIEPNESLQRVFNDSNAEMESIRQKVYSKDRNLEFWILVAAVKQFFIEEHKLPLKGFVEIFHFMR